MNGFGDKIPSLDGDFSRLLKTGANLPQWLPNPGLIAVYFITNAFLHNDVAFRTGCFYRIAGPAKHTDVGTEFSVSEALVTKVPPLDIAFPILSEFDDAGDVLVQDLTGITANDLVVIIHDIGGRTGRAGPFDHILLQGWVVADGTKACRVSVDDPFHTSCTCVILSLRDPIDNSLYAVTVGQHFRPVNDLTQLACGRLVFQEKEVVAVILKDHNGLLVRPYPI